MAFFDLPPDEELSPEVRQTFAEYQRLKLAGLHFVVGER